MFDEGEAPPKEQLNLDELVRVRSSIIDLKNSAGWKYLCGRLVEMANEKIGRWTKGGLSETESARLGAQVDLIGEVMALPDRDLSEYAFLDEGDGNDDVDGGNPFSCPTEPPEE